MKSIAPLFTPASPEPEEFAAWLASRREIIARDGYALRAGAGARGHTIEIKSLTPHEHLAADDPMRTNVWCVLALPDGAREFAQRSDRDAVLERLLESAGAGAQECEHEWELVDESFDHAFGTEPAFRRECRKCGASESCPAPGRNREEP